MIFVCLILIVVVNPVNSFNVESRQHHRIVFSLNKNDNSSFFGYGVAMQSGKKGIIVSAPNFNNKDGGIFECHVEDMRCRQIFRSENPVRYRFAKREAKTQHLGATLQSTDRYILSCSPSWHQIHKRVYWYRGRCTLLDRKSKVSHMSPCLNKQSGNKKYGLCVSGLSSAIKTVNNKTFVLVGSPGALRFKGILSAHVKTEETIRDIFSEISSANNHSLIGYSIAWGNFTNSKFGELIGGAPRGNNMKGSVIVYTIDDNKLTERITIKSPDPQVGAYFGASLCTIDFNGNGIDTLLIGSPMHSKSYDEGRVYVFDVTTNEYVVFNSVLKLEGQSIPGRHFGTTITNIGDIDNDGYRDVAIGCLKNGRSENDGSGAVYIYNGGLNGLRKKYSQIIYSSAGTSGKSGFGASITGGVDIDENGYTDIGIGEYQKGKAYIFKSRPVLTLLSNLKSNVTSIPPEVSRSNCIGPDQKRYYCIMLELVVQQHIKQTKVKQFILNVTTNFDKNMFRKRAYLVDPFTKTLQSKLTETITFNASSNFSKSSRIAYVSVAVDNDISLPVTIETRFTAYENEKICRQRLCPVLDVYGVKKSSLEIPYLRQCGEDRTCTPDLMMNSVFRVPEYPSRHHITLGSPTNIFHIETNVTNKDEPAYGTTLRMNISSDIFVVRVEVNKESSPYSSNKLGSKFYQISVPLANPLLQNKTLYVIVKMSLHDKQTIENMYTFGVEVVSTGVDINEDDNRAPMNIPVKFESCISVDGNINPPLIMYSINDSLSSSRIITDKGPEINFTYFVQNSGRLPVESLITEISLPTYFDDLELIYVYDLTANDVRCKANKLNVRKYFSSVKEAETKVKDETHHDMISRHKRFITNIACTNGTCITYDVYKCIISLIKPRDAVKVNLVTRFLQANIKRIKRRPNSLSSKFQIYFGGKHSDIMVQNKNCHSRRTAHALLQESSGVQENMRYLRWWVLLISIICSVIFLAIICAILYRMGFFKRKKLEEEREKEEEHDECEL